MALPTGALPISFFSVAARAEVVDRQYTGGLKSFDEHYPDAKRTVELRMLSFMSWADVENGLEELDRAGLRLEDHLAVADMMHGELAPAPGVQFQNVSHGPIPQWLVTASEEVAR